MTRRIVALVPARSGSKRILNKNLRLLSGIPLIAWTIRSARESARITDVIVSTESGVIAEEAKRYGARIPFMRPENLSTDTASTDDVIMHAVAELDLQDDDILMLLQPTSPLRTAASMDKALELLENNAYEGVVSVTECEHSPLWVNVLPDDLTMGNFISDSISSTRSQDLPSYYRLNGAIYAYKVRFLREHKRRRYTKQIRAFVMPLRESVDIDSPADFEYAEFLSASIDRKARNASCNR